MWSFSSEPGMRRSPSYEHAVLLSLGAQEGESVPDEGVGISDHVAPQRRGAHEVLVYVGEGFHHECARVEERYLHEIQPGPGGARDHTLCPLGRPDKGVGPES